MCSNKTQRPNQPFKNNPDVGKYYVAPTREGDRAEYQAWDAANFKYQQAEAQRIETAQMGMQQAFYDQQSTAQAEQMSLSKEMQEKQLAAQADLAAMEKQMAEQQAIFRKQVEEQRLQFEKDSAVARTDSQRTIDLAKKQADKQSAFDVGRANNRKNAGGALASKGTKALQIGLNTYDSGQTAGLAIPT